MNGKQDKVTFADFETPMDIVNTDSLEREEKVRLLKQWEVDARRLSVASEEGMTSESSGPLKAKPVSLEQVMEAQNAIDMHSHAERPDTKG